MDTTLPDEVTGPAQPLYDALKKANEATRQGVSKKELDAFLLDRYGMTKAALTQAVKAMPQEVAKKPLTTKTILMAEAYGVTGGWTDEISGLIGALKGTGYAKARKAAQEEMKQFENDYPWLARAAKAYGLGAGALAGGLLARGVVAAGAGRGISAATLAGSDAPHLGVGTRALVGSVVGGNAGAGGMLGETSGQARLPNAATGALIGGTAAGASGLPMPASPVGKLLPWLGGAAAGVVGKKLLNYLGSQR